MGLRWSLLVLLAAFLPVPLSGQDSQSAGLVTRAHLVADFRALPPQVEVQYTLRSVPQSRILGVQVLPADGVEVPEVQVEVGGRNRGVVGLAASPTGLLRSGVALGPRGDDEVDLELTLRYELTEIDSAWVETVVPVVLAGSGVDDSRPGFFTAEVTLPAGREVLDMFPAVFTVAQDSTGTVLSTSTTVIPAFLRIRTGNGRRTSLVAEVLAIGLLLLAVGLGWKWFAAHAFDESARSQ